MGQSQASIALSGDRRSVGDQFLTWDWGTQSQPIGPNINLYIVYEVDAFSKCITRFKKKKKKHQTQKNWLFGPPQVYDSAQMALNFLVVWVCLCLSLIQFDLGFRPVSDPTQARLPRYITWGVDFELIGVRVPRWPSLAKI